MRFPIAAISALILSTGLSGCAMPPAISVASALLDGISYLATEKTTSDHVLSEVTQRDCAVWRVVKDELICRAYTDGDQGILAAMADRLEGENPAATSAARTDVQPVGQISAAGPADVVTELPEL